MTIINETNPRPENEPSPPPPPLTPQPDPGPTTPVVPTETPNPPSARSGRPPLANGKSNREKIEEFLFENPRMSFSTREIAAAIGKPLGATSATLSSYFPFMKIVVDRMDVNPLGGQPVRYYRYDASKEIPPGSMHSARMERKRVIAQQKKQAKQVKQQAKQQLKQQQIAAQVPVAVRNTAEEFAVVMRRDGRNIFLLLDNGDVVKGKVMAE